MYQDSFNINKAPITLKDALDLYESERASTKFGYRNDQGLNVEAAACSTMTGSTVLCNIQQKGVNDYISHAKNSLPSATDIASSKSSILSGVAPTAIAIQTGKHSASHVPTSTTLIPINPSTLHPRTVDSTAAHTDDHKENVQLSSNNCATPAQAQNQSVGLSRFKQQSTMNIESAMLDNYQKPYTSNVPLTSLQQLQESINLSIICHETVNDGYNRVIPLCVPSSHSGTIHPTKISAGRSDMLSLDASSRARLSLPSSFSSAMPNDSDVIMRKRGVLHKDEADCNSSGPAKRPNPYHNSKSCTELPN